MDKIDLIMNNYSGDSAAVRTNLYRLLSHGRLGGSGKLLILPVDQGMEHGPDRSFAKNLDAYDPHYHFELAIEAGLSAYAAPLGMLECGAHKYHGRIPLILKLNSSNLLMQNSYDQSITSGIKDAVKLGCVGVGFTIYPGSEYSFQMIEEIAKLGREAKEQGLLVVIWSYPRGTSLKKEDETAIDVSAYAAHIAAEIGAHIIKVKPPAKRFSSTEMEILYRENKIEVETLADRVRHIKKSAFDGKRLVVFSGGVAKDSDAIYEEISQIAKGGGDGAIIGRNSFQRPFRDSIALLDKITEILLS